MSNRRSFLKSGLLLGGLCIGASAANRLFLLRYNPDSTPGSLSGVTGIWALDYRGFSGLLGSEGTMSVQAGSTTPGNAVNHLNHASKATSFDGSTYLKNSISAGVPTGDMTMACWVKPAAVNQNCIGSFQSAYQSTSYDKTLYIDGSGHAVFYVFNGNARRATGTSVLSTGQWYFICGTVKNGTGNGIWVNGINETTNALGGASASFTGSLFLAASTHPADLNGANNFNGVMASFETYNRALSSTDVNNLMLITMAPRPKWAKQWLAENRPELLDQFGRMI